MNRRADLIGEMLNLGDQRDRARLYNLTRELISHREHPERERSQFGGTQRRGIPGFTDDLAPRYHRILVTGGTGCIGHAVLSRLARERPSARLISVARRRPAIGRRVDGVTYLTADVRDRAAMTSIMVDQRPQLVFHLAAQRDPSYAEANIVETVSTNVLGSSIVLTTAGEAGVAKVVVASTGKAVRLYTSDVYAATKKVVEYMAAAAMRLYGMNVTCARFTHVVDNSIVAARIGDWIANDEAIQLHSPDAMLPVQSALECYHLLIVGTRLSGPTPTGVALRDAGWPPVGLLDMTLDHLAAAPGSLARITFTGYPAGYEATAYPGTYDPRTAGDVSPLINFDEALRTTPADDLQDHVDRWDLINESHAEVDEALADLLATSPATPTEGETGRLLKRSSAALLAQMLDGIEPTRIARVHMLGSPHDPAVVDHRYIHAELEHRRQRPPQPQTQTLAEVGSP